ncbi:MAG: transposase [Flavobacteriales bacterium Tduv]
MKKPGNKRHPDYSKIPLFKMMLLNHWYDLSDVETEELVKESLICMNFCGFRLEDHILNHMTLCRFHNEIVAKKAYGLLLKKINKELEKHQAIVKKGVIVDASITMSLFAPNWAPTYVVEDRKKEEKKQISQRKERVKKRDSIRSRHLRKMTQEIR